MAAVLTDGGARSAVAAMLRAAGWRVAEGALAEALAGVIPACGAPVGAVVATSADPLDLAEVVAGVRHRDPHVPVVLLGDRADGTLLSRLLRVGGGRLAYGLTGDDVAELVARAAACSGCATSPALADALLGGLGTRGKDHDLALAALLLAGGARDQLVAEVARRPDLLEAVVDDALSRALKRLALAAAPDDRAWLALVLNR